jgi:hypothetical protein
VTVRSTGPQQFRRQPDLVEILAHIAHARGEGDGPILPFRIAGEELAVLLERRAAACRVDDVHVGAAVLEGRDVALREGSSARHLAGVNRDRTAAALSRGDDDAHAGGVENAHGRLVPRREGDLHDAAGMQERGRAHASRRPKTLDRAG